MVKEDPSHINIATLYRKMQRRHATIILHIRIRTVFKQQLYDIGTTTHGCDMQRRNATIISHIWICSMLK